jgi:two-component system, response regulator FlrC
MTSQPRIILIVEDEPDILYILRGLIRELTAGYEIVAVSNGNAALEQLAQRSVALVVTDYHMPEMTGLQLAEQVRAGWPDVPVIMVTAYSTARIEKQAAAAGVREFLAKPFALEHLKAALARVLGAKS